MGWVCPEPVLPEGQQAPVPLTFLLASPGWPLCLLITHAMPGLGALVTLWLASGDRLLWAGCSQGLIGHDHRPQKEGLLPVQTVELVSAHPRSAPGWAGSVWLSGELRARADFRGHSDNRSHCWRSSLLAGLVTGVPGKTGLHASSRPWPSVPGLSLLLGVRGHSAFGLL